MRVPPVSKFMGVKSVEVPGKLAGNNSRKRQHFGHAFLNMGKLKKVPLLLLCQNNTHIHIGLGIKYRPVHFITVIGDKIYTRYMKNYHTVLTLKLYR